MGLAVVDQHTCLPYAAGKACQLCVDACHHAGHDAMEFLRVPLKTDEHGLPASDGGGVNAPVVLKDKCVGCGLCQARCQSVNAGSGGPLRTAAITVQAGPGREDRIARGSYLALRKAEADAARQAPKSPGGGAASQPTTRPAAGGGNGYVTDF
jgi:NAD-dependent dihydropyrimidine dehydrogenase PreA subunit